jgi:hypothetical protein
MTRLIFPRFVNLLLFASAARAAYVLQDDYPPATFADQFNFATGDDPTHGYVNYVDRATAEQTGIYKVDNGKVSCF